VKNDIKLKEKNSAVGLCRFLQNISMPAMTTRFCANYTYKKSKSFLNQNKELQ